MKFDLNYYLNRNIEVVLKDKVLHVKQPSMAMRQKLNEIEQGITAENLIEKRVAVLKVLLDNNIEGFEVPQGELYEYPEIVVSDLITKLNEMYYEAEKDPN